MLIVKEGEKMYISNVFINNFRIFSEEERLYVDRWRVCGYEGDDRQST